jgi:MoxR-like ATPase
MLSPAMFIDTDDTLERLAQVGYFTTRETAQTIYLAGVLNKPILLEGPAGAGKTEMALAVKRATGMDLVRLQCYEGLTDKEAIGSYSEELRALFVRFHQGSFGEARDKIADRDFFLGGPLVESLETPKRCILLIDEIDKISHAFEAQLLEFLNDWKLTIPQLGEVTTKHAPFTIVTANDERQLGYPLLRRCARLYIDHPTPELEATIVASRTPKCAKEIHYFIAGFAQTLRAFTMEKPPSISEMITLAQALDKLNLKEIRDEHKAVMLPFIAKTEKDRKTLLIGGRFEQFMDNARILAEEMKARDMQKAVAQKAADVQAGESYECASDTDEVAAQMLLEDVTQLEGVAQ